MIHVLITIRELRSISHAGHELRQQQQLYRPPRAARHARLVIFPTATFWVLPIVLSTKVALPLPLGRPSCPSRATPPTQMFDLVEQRDESGIPTFANRLDIERALSLVERVIAWWPQRLALRMQRAVRKRLLRLRAINKAAIRVRAAAAKTFGSRAAWSIGRDALAWHLGVHILLAEHVPSSRETEARLDARRLWIFAAVDVGVVAAAAGLRGRVVGAAGEVVVARRLLNLVGVRVLGGGIVRHRSGRKSSL
ncbi:hypothetical protein EXIGLDRAFT_207304 [Exidia glandulosa HHB12029]|uniref:Uncharacterized protein n=1 Tax=Exidia glandulosa HHB12029 TaxID=1314781 RepID=A0A165ELG3_EXIGL|nr:hypothetical protein EXIGLDRAFT_207304 [Exidia glandulosa HHB12029]